MNKMFVIEGTDGSGKQTQTTMLYDRLLKEKKDVFRTSFPNYDSLSSGPVREYLNGNISKDANLISPKAASAFFAVDRYITYNQIIKKYYTDDKTTILLDRYVSSNLLHQGGKILAQGEDYNKLDEYTKWLYNLEFNDMGIPKPTLVFFLYLPSEEAIKAMIGRENKITHESKKDIHESDPNHLKNAEKSGYYLAKKLGWYIVNCMDINGNRRTREDINNEIYSVISKYM